MLIPRFVIASSFAIHKVIFQPRSDSFALCHTYLPRKILRHEFNHRLTWRREGTLQIAFRDDCLESQIIYYRLESCVFDFSSFIYAANSVRVFLSFLWIFLKRSIKNLDFIVSNEKIKLQNILIRSNYIIQLYRFILRKHICLNRSFIHKMIMMWIIRKYLILFILYIAVA